MMELGACVSLLVKCHPLGCDRTQQEKTKVAHFAKVTGRSGRETFSLLATCHFNLPRVFVHAFWETMHYVNNCWFSNRSVGGDKSVFQSCACGWCCHTNTSGSLVLSIVPSVLRAVFLLCHSCRYTLSLAPSLTHDGTSYLAQDCYKSHHTFLVAEPLL